MADSISRSPRAPVYEDNDADYDRVQRLMESVLDASLAEIAARLDTRGEGVPLVVCNPLAWTRSEPVQLTLRLSASPKCLVIRDTEGRTMLTQTLCVRQEGHYWQADVLFLARDVPALGYRVFRAWDEEPGGRRHENRTHVVGTRDILVLENEFLRVTVNRHTGHIASILDKKAAREALAGPGNVLQAIAEIPGRSTAWMIALSDQVDELCRREAVEVVHSGPAQATVRVGTRYRDSYFSQDITLYAGMPRVDVRLQADWYERDSCLKVAFPVAVEGGQATFEAPLGTVVRPADGAEVPAQRWTDVSNAEYGVSLLNDCRYAFDVTDNRLRMTIVRGIPDLDPEADVGHHDLRYALYPHQGDWRQGGTVRQGWAFNVPLIARQALRRAGVIAPWIARGINHAMPPAFAFLEVEPENVVLAAFKLEQEDWGPGSPVIGRFYETAGQPTEAQVSFAAPFMMLEETNHLEAPIESDGFEWKDNEVAIRFRPHEIKTFRFRLAIPAFAIYEGRKHRDDIAPGFLPGFEGG